MSAYSNTGNPKTMKKVGGLLVTERIQLYAELRFVEPFAICAYKQNPRPFWLKAHLVHLKWAWCVLSMAVGHYLVCTETPVPD